MPRTNSTAIARVRPGIGDKFTVTFHTGESYEIEAPREVYRSLRHARSVGAHYNQNIRGKYPTVKL
jgi:hypothetical protein